MLIKMLSTALALAEINIHTEGIFTGDSFSDAKVAAFGELAGCLSSVFCVDDVGEHITKWLGRHLPVVTFSPLV